MFPGCTHCTCYVLSVLDIIIPWSFGVNNECLSISGRLSLISLVESVLFGYHVSLRLHQEISKNSSCINDYH